MAHPDVKIRLVLRVIATALSITFATFVQAGEVTSDYWQGDEAKFQKSFEMGPGAFFIDDIELGESRQTYRGQVSFAITDPASGDVVGAITIGLNAAAFF